MTPAADALLAAFGKGLLPRFDIHTLFARGYVSVRPDHQYEVSRRPRRRAEPRARTFSRGLAPPRAARHTVPG